MYKRTTHSFLSFHKTWALTNSITPRTEFSIFLETSPTRINWNCINCKTISFVFFEETVTSRLSLETVISAGQVAGISNVKRNGMLGTAFVVLDLDLQNLIVGMSDNEARERYVNKAKALFASQGASFY